MTHKKIAVLYLEGMHVSLFLSPQAFWSPMLYLPEEIDIDRFQKLAIVDLYHVDKCQVDIDTPSETILYCTTTNPLFGAKGHTNTERLRYPTKFLVTDLPVDEMQEIEKEIIPQILKGTPVYLRGWIKLKKDNKNKIIDKNIMPCAPEDLIL